MDRRQFLQALGAVTMMPSGGIASQPQSAGATVLYDDRVITLDRVRTDAKNPSAVWVRKADLPRINGFELKPQGACRDDFCIPIPPTMTDGDEFDLGGFAGRTGQATVAEPSA